MFDQDTLNSAWQSAGAAKTATKTAPQKSPGLASRLLSGLTQAPKYFLNTDIVNPAKEVAAQLSGNNQAMANAENAQTKTIGSTPGEALKRLAGNTAQLVATVAAPEAKGASIGSKIVAGAKGGAIVGAGSAAANDQGILKGAAEGAAVGGAIPLGAKILGVGGNKAAGSVTDDVPTTPLGKLKANINNHAQQTEAAAAGSNAGAKLPGSGPAGISLQRSQELTQLADKYKIPAGSPATKLRYIQGQLNSAGSDIDQKIAQNNVPLDSTDKQAIMDEFQKRVNEQPNAASLQGKASELSDHFLGKQTIGGRTVSAEDAEKMGLPAVGSNVKDLQGLNKYRQLVDEGINYNRTAGAPDPAAEQVGNIMRNTLSDQIGKYAPDVAGANKTFSELKSLEAPTLMENQKLAQTTGGLTNRLVNNNAVKGIEAKVANAGRRVTGGTSAPPVDTNVTPYQSPTQMVGQAKNALQGTVSKVLGSPVTQGAATLAGASAAGNPPPTTPTTAPTDTTQSQPSTQIDTDELGNAPDSTDTSSTTPQFTQQDLVAAIASDPQNATTYEDLYKTLNTGTSATAGLDTTQQKEVAASESAINRIQQYGSQIDQLTGGSNGNVATGTLSTLLGKYDPLASDSDKQAASLKSSQRDVAIQLATALSGGTKPSAASVNEIEGSLPSVNDSAQEREDKINAIVSGLQENLKTYATPVSQLVSGLQ